MSRVEILIDAFLALLTGAGLWALWSSGGFPLGAFSSGLEGHGPDPFAWPHLLMFWAPAAQLSFMAAYAWLDRTASHPAVRRCFVADRFVSLAFLVWLVGILLALRGLGVWRVWLGAWYVLFVIAKTALFLRAVWRWLTGASPSEARATTAVFLGAFLPYLFLGAHLTTAISATGDEPYYLLVTHSLLHDGDWDLGNDFASRAYLPFYWGRLNPDTSGVVKTADGRIYAKAFQGVQSVLLLPGYWMAGRTGAVITMNVVSALALALTFRIVLLTGASLRAAFLTWLGTTFSVPLLSFGASPWPEMTGALGLTCAVFLLLREPRIRNGHLAAALCLVVAAAAKPRLFVLAVPVALGWPRRISLRVGAALATVIVTGVAAMAAYDRIFLDGSLIRRTGTGGMPALLGWLVTWTVQAPSQYRGHLGLLFDQEFGLLASAPIFALALAGAAVGIRERRWRLMLVTVGPFALGWYYFGAFVTSRGPQWYGGFSPPSRFLAAALPLLAVCGALALDRLRGRLAWSVVGGLYVATFGYALVVSLWPAGRFQDAVGRSTVLREVFARTGVDPGRLLPSYIAPSEVWVAPGVALLIAILGVGWLLARSRGTAPPPGAGVVGGVGVGLMAFGALLLLWFHPQGSYSALLGQGRRGTPFHGVITVDTGDGVVSSRESLAWATRGNADIELAPRLRGGRYEIRIVAGSQGRPIGPTMSVLLGSVARPSVPLPGAIPPAWTERAYVSEISWPGGRLPIRVEFTEVASDSRSRNVYLHTIDIRRLGG